MPDLEIPDARRSTTNIQYPTSKYQHKHTPEVCALAQAFFGLSFFKAPLHEQLHKKCFFIRAYQVKIGTAQIREPRKEMPGLGNLTPFFFCFYFLINLSGIKVLFIPFN
jgi:hypothetical protein